MTFAPRFSPDGQKVIMSLLRDDGNSNIFSMDLRSRTTTRLTNSNAIDTSPSYSPDGSKIVFTSDRGGRSQIYVMGADGSGQTRISFGDGAYSTPVWSPRGDLIAFTKQTGGEFAIGVMRTDGSGERILSTGFQQEGPTWAPNGRYIMFFREAAGSGGPRLFSIDLTGRNEQQIPTAELRLGPGLVAAARVSSRPNCPENAERRRGLPSAPPFRLFPPRVRRTSAAGKTIAGTAAATNR